ncbi:hypothetical protein [Actinomadura sp. 6K520]|uniref:hypothetical protein n=1 Tax=Actinomadura sp. 6K520 TaxID=2530364 RepID=UPI00104B709F|nr:hypothetical protein [Actinomadura sp. 6K520]TDE24013.1 hypothetical protein E1289_28080 [Actinomadura sp. 6K520]
MRNARDERFVFDPLLPPDMLARLREARSYFCPAEPGTAPVTRHPRRERLRRGAVPFAGAAAVIVALEVAGMPLAALVAGVIGLFLYVPPRLPPGAPREKPFAIDVFWWIVGGGWMLWALLCIALLAAGVFSPQLLLLHVARYVHFVIRLPKGPLDFVPPEHFVDLTELGPIERTALGAVQDARNQVAEAQRLLGGAFDGTEALMVLREEEWGLAARLRRLAPLSREVDELTASAASQRVLDAMAPQRAVVDQAREAVMDRAADIERYIRPIDAAIRAKREWEQILHLERSVDGYADVLAEAAADVPGAIPDGADPGGGTALEAARRTLEARIGEAVQANRWLLDAARRAAGDAAERRRPEPR